MAALAAAVVIVLTIAVPARADWREFELDGMRLVTDLPAATANRMLLDLADYEGLVDAFVPEPPIPRAPDAGAQTRERPEIWAFARARDFQRLFRPSHYAAFTLPDVRRIVLVMGPSTTRGQLQHHVHLRHEYVHFRMRLGLLDAQPLWFEEGFADLLSHARRRGDRWRVGARSGADPALAPLPVETLLSLRNTDALRYDQAQSFYRCAELLVRELVTRHPPAELLANLALEPSDPQATFDSSPQALNQLLRRSLQRSLRPVLDVPAAPPPSEPRIVVRPVDELERLLRLGDVVAAVNAPGAVELFEAAVAARGGVPAAVGLARARRLNGDRGGAGRALELAEELSADDASARLMIRLEQAYSATESCIDVRQDACRLRWEAARDELRAVLEQTPDDFRGIYRLGLAHLFLGESGAAIAYLRIVFRRAPWSPNVNFFLGEAYRMAGDPRARVYLDRARRWSMDAALSRSIELAFDELDGVNSLSPAETAPTRGD